MTGLSHIAQSERSDVEALENEVELLEAELHDERTARLVVDNQLERAYDAIAEHQKSLLNKQWGSSATEADQRLWQVLDER